jgi:uncharacterized protein
MRMKLTPAERWILSNQFSILERLNPDDAEHYRNVREAIECGYETDYDTYSPHIYTGADVTTEEESMEVIEILAMFDALKQSYKGLSDKSGIDESRIQFHGFDGNTEGKQMAYARYFCSLDGGRFTDLDRGDNFNSHMPVLDWYRRMLAAWNASTDKYHLRKSDIERIISA